ncbi:hypothetical protein GPALN_007412 [Globodera pallida]|nr:hypothetical protein GPALN_007412 [Globodera pallida]
MTGTWLDETFEFHSRVLSVTSFLSRHTGENICREIDSTIDKLCIEKVVAATRDAPQELPHLEESKGSARQLSLRPQKLDGTQ